MWFTKDPYIVSFMRNNMHLNVYHYNEAFNVRIHHRPETQKEVMENEVCIDVMTYGTMYPYRCRMLKTVVDSGIDLKIYGILPHRFYNHELDDNFQNKYIVGDEKARLLYGAKIVFNQMYYGEIESVNNRFFETNGSGAFQLSDYRPILNTLLPVDPKLVSFTTIDDGIEKIKYYLAHDKERYEIAETVYQHFINNYTYDHLVNYILSKT
jgi:spore maturation protein CgeB